MKRLLHMTNGAPRFSGLMLRQRGVLAAMAIGLACGAQMMAQEPASGSSGPDAISKPEHAVNNTRNAHFAMKRPWQKNSDLVGKTVVDSANEDIGQIKDIVVDARSGRILYGVLSFGGIAGVGDKLFAVPWPALQLQDDAKALKLDVKGDTLKKSPGFDEEHWPDRADPAFARPADDVHNQPHGQASDQTPAAGNGTHSGADHVKLLWQKTSDLCGKQVLSMDGKNVGEMRDLVISPSEGRVRYGIVFNHGQLVAVPWRALGFTSHVKAFSINVDAQKLTEAPHFTRANWPDFADRSWAQKMYAYFHVQPGRMRQNASNTDRNAVDGREPAVNTAPRQRGQNSIDLTAAISRKIDTGEFSVTSRDLQIQCREGKVTLRGSVKDQSEKQKIGRIATDVAGAGNVDNRLEVASK